MRIPTQGVPEGALLWTPSPERAARSRLGAYLDFLATRKDLRFPDYATLWRWSVDEVEAFWASIWEHFEVGPHRPPSRVLSARIMPGARWFEGAELNYAAHALRGPGDAVAVIHRSETEDGGQLTFAELGSAVARAAAGLRRLGVRRGDRVAALLPNRPEALIAFLATASLGATWSSCAPEFGVPSVLDRFRQIEPTVLLAVDGYRFGGRAFDRTQAVREIRAGLPTLRATVLVRRPGSDAGALPGAESWADLLARAAPLDFESVPFEHPLWILYSSGTTGLPKPIVHGHGGILLEHLKTLALQCDLGEGDRFFWFTTTGWMMWNLLIGGLLVGATVVLYDGSPAHPDLGVLWRLSDEVGATYLGVSAPYLLACRKEGLLPREIAHLGTVRTIGSTGAPLPADGFGWVYQAVKADVLLASISGGTDLCTAFVVSAPTLPVHAGEIQCRALGARVEAFDAGGHPLEGEVGELVITEPMPSMPIGFWNDPDGRRRRASYFDTYPGVWRHGDWIKITPRGSCVIYGRSDATLNRGGVRMGTSEFYHVVESLPDVQDSLVVDTGGLEGEDRLWLFVVPRAGMLDEAARQRIREALRRQVSPRHVPDEIVAIAEVPRTLNGKKLEVPVKRILAGTPPEQAVNQDTLANPDALAPFLALARPALTAPRSAGPGT